MYFTKSEGLSLSLLQQIKEGKKGFTKSEEKIAGYILNNVEEIPTLTTKELSLRCKVSEASIVRFCRTIGLKGYKTFKMSLVRELSGNDYINEVSRIHKDDLPLQLFMKVTNASRKALDMAESSLDRKVFERVIEKCVGANRIFFFGVGGSAVSAMDATYKFSKLGYPSLVSYDFHMAINLITSMEKKDLFVGISTSGKTKEVVELARLAKKRGICVVAITKLEKTPLYKTADFPLCIPDVEQDYRIGSIASRTSQLNIVDALYINVFNRLLTSILLKPLFLS